MDRQLKCPACGRDMKEVLIKDRNVKIDICFDGCGGIFFDNRELNQFTDTSKDIKELVDLLKDRKFDEVDENKSRQCPVCGLKMVKNFASPKKTVNIDQCYTCGGVFLDNKELSQIRGEYDNTDELRVDVEKMIEDNFGEELKKSELEAKEAEKIDTVRELLLYLGKKNL